MKKQISVLLALAMLASMTAACGDNADKPDDTKIGGG